MNTILAHLRGDSEDFYHASAVYENQKFIKTVNHKYAVAEDDGLETYEEITIYEIEFNPNTLKIIEKKLEY